MQITATSVVFYPAAASRAGQAGAGGAKDAGTPRADSAEQQQLAELQARDREVRAHEQAHLAAAGGVAVSGATFSFQRGPDGQLYAIGGEVRIDTSPVQGDPQATLEKAEQIGRAALAPVHPSDQDRAVAAQAAQMARQAQAELARSVAGLGDSGTTAPTVDVYA